MLRFSLARFFPAALLLAALGAATLHAAEPTPALRLYTLDCGHADFKDMGMFSDTGEYDGKPGRIIDSCFLVQHGRDWLLWDTGLGDGIAANKDGVDNNGIHLSVPITLTAQLKQLGLAPADVTLVAFSHFHFDHTGNANLFSAATWIVNKAELAWAIATPSPFGVAKDSFSAYAQAKTRTIDNDEDVFGDGSVRILKAPGHTPGSQVLLLNLAKSGHVVLSGDLYHTRANRTQRRVPHVNVERADTLASIDRIEKIIANTHARLVIQHHPEDFKGLPKFPAYLD